MKMLVDQKVIAWFDGHELVLARSAAAASSLIKDT